MPALALRHRRAIGDATTALTPGQTCPGRPWWWLLVAAAGGVAAGYYVTKLDDQKKGRRR